MFLEWPLEFDEDGAECFSTDYMKPDSSLSKIVKMYIHFCTSWISVAMKEKRKFIMFQRNQAFPMIKFCFCFILSR
jgi:hypothetical protein